MLSCSILCPLSSFLCLPSILPFLPPFARPPPPLLLPLRYVIITSSPSHHLSPNLLLPLLSNHLICYSLLIRFTLFLFRHCPLALSNFSLPLYSIMSVCCCCSDEFLVIARKSGVITRYSLPHLNIENTYIVHTEPYRYCTYSSSFILIVVLCLSIVPFYFILFYIT